MSATVRTLEELREALAEATLRAEEIDAAIQGLGATPEEGVREELDARYEEQTKEVRSIADAIERKEKMAEAIKAVPRPEKTSTTGVRVVSDELTYRKMARENDGSFRSFFADIVSSREGDFAASARLQRHQSEMAVEQRAISTSSGGVGLVPPQYLLDAFAPFARAGRPFADSLQSRNLPDAGMTFNVPRVTTGASSAVTAEAGAITDSSPVSDYLTLAVNTASGKVDVSRQLLDRSNPSTDEIIGQDLAADVEKTLDTTLLTQATNGITVLSGTNSSTVSTATAAAIWPKFADGIQLIWTNRFASPDAIVMHPRRWAMFLGALDSSNRPLVEPDGIAGLQAFNAMGVNTGGQPPQGLSGVIQGLPVITDPNIPTNLGGGTNQDVIIVTRRADQLLYEDGAPTVAVYDGVLSANLQVRIVAYKYFAFSFARYAKATSIISGTGLVTPTF